jgi:hypothetical protein
MALVSAAHHNPYGSQEVPFKVSFRSRDQVGMRGDGEPADVGGQSSQYPALAAAAPDHGQELLNGSQRLTLATGELREYRNPPARSTPANIRLEKKQ